MEYQAAGEPSLYDFQLRLIMRRTAKELAEANGADSKRRRVRTGRNRRARARGGTRFDLRGRAKHAQRAAGFGGACVIAAEAWNFLARRFCGRAAKAAFARAASVARTRAIASGIHPTAIVAPLRRIAAGVGMRAVRP